MKRLLLRTILAGILLAESAAMAAEHDSTRTNDLAASHGVWKGTLEIWGSAKPAKTIAMELHITPGATWTR